ncbi:MAG: nitroreductase family deazaflavin-dependent oxidoreductase [Nocardioides sp.]
MGLADDLGYHIPRANPFQRLMQGFASTRPGAWLFARLLRHLDDAVGRLSRGRTSTPRLLAGIPVLDVTTTGRRSGLRRTSHLIAVPYDGTLALLGTNFGQPRTPAWVLNLEADPHAAVTHAGRTAAVVARPVTDEERAAVLAGSAQVYGGYLKYQQRITHRRLRIFLLEPA